MTMIFPRPPAVGTGLKPARDSAEIREFLALRRSTPKQCLTSPGPSASDVDALLQIAARVPDHRRVEPWRFIVFEGEARRDFGRQAAGIFKRKTPEATPGDIATEQDRFLRAPTIIAVISAPDTAHKTPVWEQELSAGAACMTLLLAASAAGWAGTWLTEWLAYDADVAALLGLGPEERVAGFICLGTASAEPPERPRPDMPAKITRWQK